MKRFSVEMNGDDLILEEDPEGDWLRNEDVAPELAELARWRAMFGTPDIAASHMAEIDRSLASTTAALTRVERLLDELARRRTDAAQDPA